MAKQVPNDRSNMLREASAEDMPMRRYSHDIPRRQDCRMCAGMLCQTNWMLWEQNQLLREILAAVEEISGQNGT